MASGFQAMDEMRQLGSATPLEKLFGGLQKFAQAPERRRKSELQERLLGSQVAAAELGVEAKRLDMENQKLAKEAALGRANAIIGSKDKLVKSLAGKMNPQSLANSPKTMDQIENLSARAAGSAESVNQMIQSLPQDAPASMLMELQDIQGELNSGNVAAVTAANERLERLMSKSATAKPKQAAPSVPGLPEIVASGDVKGFADYTTRYNSIPATADDVSRLGLDEDASLIDVMEADPAYGKILLMREIRKDNPKLAGAQIETMSKMADAYADQVKQAKRVVKRENKKIKDDEFGKRSKKTLPSRRNPGEIEVEGFGANYKDLGDGVMRPVVNIGSGVQSQFFVDEGGNLFFTASANGQPAVDEAGNLIKSLPMEAPAFINMAAQKIVYDDPKKDGQMFSVKDVNRYGKKASKDISTLINDVKLKGRNEAPLAADIMDAIGDASKMFIVTGNVRALNKFNKNFREKYADSDIPEVRDYVKLLNEDKELDAVKEKFATITEALKIRAMAHLGVRN